MERQIVQHLRTSVKDKKPTSSDILNGEIAVNCAVDGETLYIKNSNDEIAEFKDKKYIDNKISNCVEAVETQDTVDDVTVDYATKAYIDGLVGDINSILENIINGGDEINLITFTINGVEYQAEEGMTWGEWVESSYNTNGFFIDQADSGDAIYYSGYEKYVTGINVDGFNIRQVSDVTIIANNNYTLSDVNWPI